MERPKELKWRGASVHVLKPTSNAELQEELAATQGVPVAIVLPARSEGWLEAVVMSGCVAVFHGPLTSEEQAAARGLLATETIYVSPSLAGPLFLAWRRAAQGAYLVQGLTVRECDIMALLAQGRSNREIANLLFISPHTVRNHLSRIFAKLDISSRTQARNIWRLAHPGTPTHTSSQND